MTLLYITNNLCDLPFLHQTPAPRHLHRPGLQQLPRRLRPRPQGGHPAGQTPAGRRQGRLERAGPALFDRAHVQGGQAEGKDTRNQV